MLRAIDGNFWKEEKFHWVVQSWGNVSDLSTLLTYYHHPVITCFAYIFGFLSTMNDLEVLFEHKMELERYIMKSEARYIIIEPLVYFINFPLRFILNFGFRIETWAHIRVVNYIVSAGREMWLGTFRNN